MRDLFFNNSLAFKQSCLFRVIEAEPYRLLYWHSARALGCYTCRTVPRFPRKQLNSLQEGKGGMMKSQDLAAVGFHFPHREYFPPFLIQRR